MVRIQSLRLLTWDVPRPVRFDSDVRKRVCCRSQQIESHKSNSGRWHRGVTTYSPCRWHSSANRIPKGRTEKRGKSLPARLEFILLLSGAESATGKATEYQLYRIRNWCSAHWRTESLPNVWRRSSNDGVSERRETFWCYEVVELEHFHEDRSCS